MLPQWKRDVLGDRHTVEQRRLLEEEPEANPLARQLFLAEHGEVLAVEKHLAVAGPQQADHRLQQHRLAATALADHGQRLTPGNRQTDVAQHVLLPKMDLDPLEADERLIRAGDVGGSADHDG